MRVIFDIYFYVTVNNKMFILGFIDNPSSCFGKGFRKALSKWYLDRDPLLSAEQILRHKSYEGWTHKKIMKLIHIQSDNPSNFIQIL